MKKPIKLDGKIVSMLLERLSDEYTAFYFYQSAQNWTQNVGFLKAAKFFEEEGADELVHAKKIISFLTDWNITVALPDIDPPTLTFENLGELISASYTMEYDLYEAYEETSMDIFKTGDLCVFDFLQFYRKTQTESVAQYSDMLNILDGVDVSDKFKMLLLEETLFEK